VKPNLTSIAALAALLLAATPYASAPAAAEEGPLQYLVGTWNCAHTVGDFSGTYATTYVPALDNAWIRQTYDFPATQTDPAVHAEYYLSYDPRVKRLVRFGAHSNGQYYAMKTTTITDTVWSWTYVLPSPGSDLTWTRRSDGEYALDGPSYTQNGKPVTEHHVCKKAQ
jgi:hypothetical protein